MNCIYCGKPLYQHLSIRSLFRTNYRLHDECKKKMWIEATDYIPVGQTMMVIHPMFDYDKQGNENLLLFFFGEVLINAYLRHPSDVLVFVDSNSTFITNPTTLYLISQLTTTSFYVITLYRTRLL